MVRRIILAVHGGGLGSYLGGRVTRFLTAKRAQLLDHLHSQPAVFFAVSG